MKVFFDMVGCRLNQAEIDRLALELTRGGAQVVSKADQADTIIVNTCCVTKKASADSRKMIRHYRDLSNTKVISTGCWVSVEPDEAIQISDLAFDNKSKVSISNALLSHSGLVQKQITTKPSLGKRHRTRGFVKVQDGCNNSCSFCLTTIARGPSISTSSGEVIEQILELEALAVKEVVLTGVQLGSWGKDLSSRKNLSYLLSEILEHTAIPRIRLSSIEPWDIDQSLIALLGEPRICAHLHIPLQTGSDEILRRMRRPTTTDTYRKLIESIRTIAPDMSITTDVIAGFPGESDEHFEDSFQFISSLSFNGGHVFSFSPMTGTNAAELDHHVSSSLIKQRTKRLLEHFRQRSLITRQNMLGKTFEVLYESKKMSDSKLVWNGFTEQYVKVFTAAEKPLMNQLIQTKILSLNDSGNLEGFVSDLPNHYLDLSGK